MSNYLFSLPKKDEYYFKYIDHKKYNITYTYKRSNIFVKLLKKIDRHFIKKTSKFSIMFNRLTCRLSFRKKLLTNIKKGYGTVLLDPYLTEDLLFYIKNNDLGKKVFLIIWNKLDDSKFAYYSKYISKDNIFSYSLSDSKKYNISYINEFHLISLADYFPTQDDIYDIYFLGRDKGRMEIIERVATIANNLSTKIDILPVEKNCDKSYKYVNYIKKFISFDTYLENVVKTKCLLDITFDDNLSFRTLESLIFQKKLITNNKSIKNYDFYNENNILIIDNDTSESKILDFLSNPIIPISEEVLKKYDFGTIYEFFERKVVEKDERNNSSRG